VMSERHHPAVFAVGESVPALALYRNEYYYMKFMGILVQRFISPFPEPDTGRRK
jgi:hypothetical protein